MADLRPDCYGDCHHASGRTSHDHVAGNHPSDAVEGTEEAILVRVLLESNCNHSYIENLEHLKHGVKTYVILLSMLSAEPQLKANLHT